MARQRWVPDTVPFAAAVERVQTAYLDGVHEQTARALAGQERALERMRRLEKSAGATAARITKQLRSDPAPLASESQQLAQALAATQIAAAETMLTLQRIDALLPPPDRLFAPGTPHRRHYAELHRAAAAAAVPELVSRAAHAAPATQLDRAAANAAPANAGKP